mmetsp:Transcript_131527/g.195992  ORF Transcript_131527/g.195992 Transcript_131527/m.195992 type:complete len:244 (-) Transcript_131527:2-733(-)
MERSLQPEALGVGYGRQHAVPKLPSARVLRKQKHVEASVRSRQLHAVRALALDHKVELRHASDGGAIVASDELEELLLVRLTHLVHHLPKPLDDRGLRGITCAVLGDILELVEVEGGRSADEHFKLAGTEQAEQPRRMEHSEESCLKRVELRLNRRRQDVLHVQLHVLATVGVGDRDVRAVGFQLEAPRLPAERVPGLERQAKHVLNAPRPVEQEELVEAVGHFWAQVEEIALVQRLGQQLLP